MEIEVGDHGVVCVSSGSVREAVCAVCGKLMSGS